MRIPCCTKPRLPLSKVALIQCCLLISGDGEEDAYFVGGWGGQMLCEAEVFEDLYQEKAKSDLTKTQNSWINNGETNL